MYECMFSIDGYLMYVNIDMKSSICRQKCVSMEVYFSQQMKQTTLGGIQHHKSLD